MSKNITQLYGVNPTEFRESIVQVFKAELSLLFKNFVPKEPTEFLTRKEVSKILKVSIPTIIDWEKKNVLKPYRLGNLIRYKRSELDKALILITPKNQ